MRARKRAQVLQCSGERYSDRKQRIKLQVQKLCINYGRLIGRIDGIPYHSFPSPSALADRGVETRLRELGFGYRAKYIYQTAVMVAKERGGEAWLNSLRNPEAPAFGVPVTVSGDNDTIIKQEEQEEKEVSEEDLQGYRIAHDSLLELQGVGPKVADCVCLMGLGWGEAVPVDTHGKITHSYISTAAVTVLTRPSIT